MDPPSCPRTNPSPWLSRSSGRVYLLRGGRARKIHHGHHGPGVAVLGRTSREEGDKGGKLDGGMWHVERLRLGSISQPRSELSGVDRGANHHGKTNLRRTLRRKLVLDPLTDGRQESRPGERTRDPPDSLAISCWRRIFCLSVSLIGAILTDSAALRLCYPAAL
jgi:hypothetical protein